MTPYGGIDPTSVTESARVYLFGCQPDHDVHDGAPTLMVAGIMVLAPKGVYWGTRQLVCREASESVYDDLARRPPETFSDG